MSEHPAQGWIGASVLRKEDARHLLGLGSFIGDIRLPGMKDVAFLRSQHAHARLRSVDASKARMLPAEPPSPTTGNKSSSRCGGKSFSLARSDSSNSGA